MRQQSRYDRLALFAAVAEAESFSVAAAQFGLPRSSVSRAIAALEAELGVTLLHRTTRKVTVSAHGRALFERAAPGLASLQAALAAPFQDEAVGVLRITTVADFATIVLADVIAAFMLRHPRIRVELVLTEDVVDLRAQGIDVAFRFSFGKLRGGAGHVAKRIGGIEMGLYAAPRYLARAGAPRALDELTRHRTVALTSMRRARLSFEDGTRAQVLKMEPDAVADAMETCAALVRSAVGIGLLGAHTVKSDVASGALVRVLPQWSARRGSVWLVFAGKPLPTRVALFRDFVLAAAPEWF
jgi:DNA-binding transcriptional LysR family regulator